MSKTRLQIVTQAAKRLGVLASGQSLSADDYNEINDLWEPLCEELQSRRIFTVGNPEEVEDAPFMALADLLAFKSCSVFGLSAESLAAKGIVKAAAENDLEIIAAGPATKSVLTIERFWG